MLDQWKKLRNEDIAKKRGVKIIDHEQFNRTLIAENIVPSLFLVAIVVLAIVGALLVGQNDAIITKVAAYCMGQNMTLTECASII